MQTLLMMLAFLAAPEFESAQSAFEDALYEKAIERLPGDCQLWGERTWDCERLRALSAAALGREQLSIGAFARMSALDESRTASLADDLSPTRRELVERGRALRARVERIQLREVAGSLEPGAWKLMLAALPPGLPPLASVKVHLGQSEGGGWKVHALTKSAEGMVSGAIDYGADPGIRPYYLAVDVEGYGRFWVGGPQDPREVRLVALFETNQFGAVTDPWPRDGHEHQDEADGRTWWYAVAGAVVVIATGVVIGVLIAGGDDTSAAPAKP